MIVSLAQIAEIVDGEVKGDIQKMIRGAAPFETATSDDITLAVNARFLKKIDETSAAAVLVPRDFKACSKNTVHVDNPRVAFAKLLKLFYSPPKPEMTVSSNARIGKNFACGNRVSIASFVVIQDNVRIGDGVIIHPNVVIGNHVVIGNEVEIYPNVTVLDRCKIGNRVTIHAGSVIGSDGFGFAPEGEVYYKIPHLGIVQIDDDVEIGAGNTIDRATFGKTWIQRGVKTDNLVHIAHNVTVGENTLIVAQVGIAGSATIGKNVTLAGQAGITGHLAIGDNATIGPQAGVTKSVPVGEVMSGTPEMPHRLWLKVQRIIPRLPEMKKKLSELEKRLNAIEAKNSD
jgi:UDP-3-O-[3-hydroxymyristoyl] glucosamine N-acyltransferase